MQIAGINIKPLFMYLTDEEKWVQEFEEGKKHFEEVGITDTEYICGIHASKWGITSKHIYLLDGRPEQQFYIGDAKVGNFLTYYILYCVMNVMPDSHFLILEGDAKFAPDWKERTAKAIEACPDFDFMYVGSCCAEDKQPVRIGDSDVYEFPYRGEHMWQYYPMCGHAFIVNKRCVPLLIKTQRDVANPSDVSLIKYAFPHLKVVAILPRLADQGKKTHLPP